MFELTVLNKYTEVKKALDAIETIRNVYKFMWALADDNKDNNAMDEIDEKLSELDVMQVDLEGTLNEYKEYLEQ